MSSIRARRRDDSIPGNVAAAIRAGFGVDDLAAAGVPYRAAIRALTRPTGRLHAVAAAARPAHGDGEMIAALYVETGGVYYGLPDVDPWDGQRDARLYAGPHPVVAHPPCERWGRYWGGAPLTWPRLKPAMMADASRRRWRCAAVRRRARASRGQPRLARVRSEHRRPARRLGRCRTSTAAGPAASSRATTATAPARKHGSMRSVSICRRWHGASSGKRDRLDEGFHSAEERRRAVRTGICQRLSKRQRAATPVEFRDLLLGMARTCKRVAA